MLKLTTGSEYSFENLVNHFLNIFFVVFVYLLYRYNKAPSNSSPPRPSTLPISEAKPVPSTRKISRLQSPPKVSSLIFLFLIALFVFKKRKKKFCDAILFVLLLIFIYILFFFFSSVQQPLAEFLVHNRST